MARALVPALLVVGTLRADDSLAEARHARSLLGPTIWSRVVRVENEARASSYPRTLHALVFEAGGLLWFYASLEGTQSFSLHRGRLTEEKADFGPLLLAIEPGFTRWRIVKDEEQGPRAKSSVLPNGCFIESIAALRDRLARGFAAAGPRLLSFYAPTRNGLKGHTVLTFVTDEGLAVVDPAEKGSLRLLPMQSGDDPLMLARRLDSGRVAKARWIPVELPVDVDQMLRLAGGAAAFETEEDQRDS